MRHPIFSRRFQRHGLMMLVLACLARPVLVHGQMLISSGTTSGMRLHQSGSNDWWLDITAGRLDLRINGAAAAAAVTSGGNVGIGTTMPMQTLEVNGNSLFGAATTQSTFTSTGDLQLVKNSTISASGTLTISTGPTAALTGNPAIFISANGNVSIKASSDTANLFVSGISSFTNSITVNGSSHAFVPQGAVMFFNLSACPRGWTQIVEARGRYLVGVPAAGTLAATVGTALTNIQNRAVGIHGHATGNESHSHSGSVSLASGSTGACGAPHSGCSLWAGSSSYVNVTLNTTGLTITTSGTLAGTNAPYIQYLVCQKD